MAAPGRGSAGSCGRRPLVHVVHSYLHWIVRKKKRINRAKEKMCDVSVRRRRFGAWRQRTRGDMEPLRAKRGAPALRWMQLRVTGKAALVRLTRVYVAKKERSRVIVGGFVRCASAAVWVYMHDWCVQRACECWIRLRVSKLQAYASYVVVDPAKEKTHEVVFCNALGRI